MTEKAKMITTRRRAERRGRSGSSAWHRTACPRTVGSPVVRGLHGRQSFFALLLGFRPCRRLRVRPRGQRGKVLRQPVVLRHLDDVVTAVGLVGHERAEAKLVVSTTSWTKMKWAQARVGKSQSAQLRPCRRRGRRLGSRDQPLGLSRPRSAASRDGSS